MRTILVFCSLVAGLLAFSSGFAAPLVEGYPERLTLSYVLEVAEKHATIFQSLRATESSIEAPRLTAEAPLAPQLSLGVRRFDQQLQPASPFAPSRNEGMLTFAALEQGIGWTGTRFSLQLEHGDTSLRFPNTPIPPYYETRAALSVRQSLLQSLWKGADRERERAGLAGERANRIEYQRERDQATSTFIQLFYQAWLAQRAVQAAQENLKNKEDLLSITRLRVRRGTAEKPDLLQVQSGVDGARIQLDQSKRALGDLWRNLIVTLELPKELMAIDPMLVPVELDQPVMTAQAKCQGHEKAPRLITLTEARARAQAEAALARASSLKASVGPDVQLIGNYVANGIDSFSRSETVQRTARRDFPAWTVEVSARIPLGTSAIEGDALVASAQQVRAEAAAEQEMRISPVERMNRCLALQEKTSARLLAERMLTGQAERLTLEQERFRIGRSTLTQVVIASDDRVMAERALRSAEVEERLAAWQVNELTGSLQEIALGRPERKVVQEAE